MPNSAFLLLRCLLHRLCFDHRASFQGLEGAVVQVSSRSWPATGRLFGHDDCPCYIVCSSPTCRPATATNSTHDFGVKFSCRPAPELLWQFLKKRRSSTSAFGCFCTSILQRCGLRMTDFCFNLPMDIPPEIPTLAPYVISA
jgi:hypothetical protein